MPGNPTIVFPKAREVRIEDRDIPTPKPGQVLVKTRRSLISTGTELTIFSGEFPPQNSYWADYGKYPFVAGYSNVGVVEAVGDGVDPAWKGKRVGSFTAHAAWITAWATDAYPVPDEVSDEEATFFAIGLIVMNGVRLAQLQLGESVVVYGLGLIGQFCSRFCHLSGARPVIGLDVAPKRLGLLPTASGFIAQDSKAKDPAEFVKAATRGRMADVVFETTGNQNLIPGEFAALKKQGRFIVLSSPRGPSTIDFHDLVNARSTHIIGAHQMSTPEHETPYNVWTKARNTELFFDLIRRKEFACGPLVSHRSKYDKAGDLYTMLLADRSAAMGCVIEWQ